jgi:uncharacterized protein YjbI with pentapeptide repeats
MKQIRNLLSRPRNIVILVAVLLWVLVAVLYFVPGSGFGTYTDVNGEVIPAKTIWDWLSLVFVPLFLLIGGFYFNASIQQAERERAENHSKVEREIADDKQKEEALQTYLDRMSDLLLTGKFDFSETKDKAKTVARARTLTVLQRLNGERKAAVLQFLYEAGLVIGDTPTVDLRKADLSKASLKWANLQHANLEGAYLDESLLEGALLIEANLEGAFMEGANLDQANLPRANLTGTILKSASLIGTNFRTAILKWANLEQANLEAIDLEDADLERAYLVGANLAGAHLTGAILNNANLVGANLKDAEITQKQLNSAILSEDTILPDGSHYKPPASPSTSTTPPQPPAAQAPADGSTAQQKSS